MGVLLCVCILVNESTFYNSKKPLIHLVCINVLKNIINIILFFSNCKQTSKWLNGLHELSMPKKKKMRTIDLMVLVCLYHLSGYVPAVDGNRKHEQCPRMCICSLQMGQNVANCR